MLACHCIISGAIISAVVVALSSVVISKNKTVSQQEKFESRVAKRKQEEESARAELKIPGIIELLYKDAEVSSPENQQDKDEDIFYDTSSDDERDTETPSPENEPAKEENGQGWGAWSLDKAKTAAKLVVGGAIFAVAAAPTLVGTLFTGSSASPASDMFNSNGTCSRY